MFNIWLDYPSQKEEVEIVRTTTSNYEPQLKSVLSGEQILELQKLARRVPVSDFVVEYAVDLVRRTRPAEGCPDYIRQWVTWGAGPRASQYLIIGAKTRAILEGRPTPDIEDVKFAARPVLRHRIVTSFNAAAEGVTTLDIIERLMKDKEA